jgi:hypothetical protein
MIPSLNLELKIYEYAEFAGKAQWRVATLGMLSSVLQYHELSVLIDALDDLFERKYMEYQQWDYSRNGWVVYGGHNRDYFTREFQMRVTFSGRKYFESLEAESAASSQSSTHMTQLAKPKGAAEDATIAKTQHSSAQRVLAADSRNPRAFVSYGSEDRAFVERFAGDLRGYGVDAWCSIWEIKPGDSIPAKIDEGLEGCEFFIIVLSRSSVNRPWVKVELGAATMRLASGKIKKIIPVTLDDCGDLVPPTLSSLCWEDFSQAYDPPLKRVLDSIFDVDVRPPLGKRPPENTELEIQKIISPKSKGEFSI